jgi:predicted CoA-binding protein
MPELRSLRGPAEARELLSRFRNVAIVGLSDDPSRPSHAVGHYLVAQGYRVTPVNPNIDRVFGIRAVPTLDDVPHELEIVNDFRRREAIPGVVDDAIAAGARAIWLQLGLADNASETRARAAGLAVVRNRCIKVEHRAWFGPHERVEEWRAGLDDDA